MTADSTRGDRALVADLPVVKLHGQDYRLQRLSVETSILFARLISTALKNNRAAVAALDLSALNLANLTASIGLTVILDAISVDPPTTLRILAEVLGVEIGQVRDANFIGPAEMLRVFKLLPSHPDVADFLAEMGWKAAGAETETPESEPPPTTTEPGNEPSTSSSDDTDGQIPTS